MSLHSAPTPPHPAAGSASTPALRSLVLCDLVDSTALVEKLGDQGAMDLFRRHDRMARALLRELGGREIDKTDGFLLLFEHPSQAVTFALAYQRALAELPNGDEPKLTARIGIHVGDVLVWENASDEIEQGAKPVEVEGLAKPLVARLMGLAAPGQILLSDTAYALAQRSLHDVSGFTLAWRAHGSYRFKGIADQMPVYEVGDPKRAPFTRPQSSAKASRVLPWWMRPATIGAEVALLAITIGVFAYLTARSPPAIAFAERDWVVIGDLRNLTGQQVFDESLDRAFRISLEQSRFVNVVSELQVRDALKRMNRAETASVDRAVGSEIAIREGARALIVPTIAEIGGRVRVSAEVIDPHSQTTVYAESADGHGAESVLASVDSVSHTLREKLGEAVKSIENDSEPLPRVTTSNLDALRAYALAVHAYSAGKWAESIPLYKQAIALDPGFALAQMGLARTLYASENVGEAHQRFQLALAQRDRLPARDQLYLDAWLATFDKPTEAIEKWKLMAQLYPDFFGATANVALFSFFDANRARDAQPYAEAADSPHNPFRRSARYLVGTLQLAQDNYAGAIESFRKAEELGIGGSIDDYANAYASQRDFTTAAQILTRHHPTGVASGDIFERLNTIAWPVDQGRWQEARDNALAVSEEASRLGGMPGRVFSEIALSLSALDRDSAFPARLLAAAAAERTAGNDPSNAAYRHTRFSLAALAYFAARSGHADLAQSLLAEIADQIPALSFPNADSMLAIAQAEVLRTTGQAGQAIAQLGNNPDDPALFQTRVVLMNALVDNNRLAEALAQADWLAAHRGRAYAENGGHYLLRALNVADTNLALLRGAEIALLMADPDGARRRRDQFLKAWPDAGKLPWLAGRLRELQSRL